MKFWNWLKDFQNLIGMILIAAAIIIAGNKIASVFYDLGGVDGSQISSAIQNGLAVLSDTKI